MLKLFVEHTNLFGFGPPSVCSNPECIDAEKKKGTFSPAFRTSHRGEEVSFSGHKLSKQGLDLLNISEWRLTRKLDADKYGGEHAGSRLFEKVNLTSAAEEKSARVRLSFAMTTDWKELSKSSLATDGGPTNEAMIAEINTWVSKGWRFQSAVGTAVRDEHKKLKLTPRNVLAIQVCAARCAATFDELQAYANEAESTFASGRVTYIAAAGSRTFDHPLLSSIDTRPSADRVDLVHTLRGQRGRAPAPITAADARAAAARLTSMMSARQ
jgi:hypothetical protein